MGDLLYEAVSAAPLTLRLSGGSIDVINTITSGLLASQPLADTTVAAALGMAPGAAALRCRYVITDDHDRTVQAATYYYRGDRFRLTLEIRTTAPGEASDGQRIADWPLAVTSDAAATSSRGRAAAPRRPRGRKR